LTEPPRILVVDDEPPIGRSIRRGLKTYEVVVEHAPEAALDRIGRGEAFHFILADVTMPGIDGVEFYERVVAIAPHLEPRVLFMTGWASSGPGAFLSTIPDRVLQKPFATRELIAFLESRAAVLAR
jgi:DNA-binding response OmpR family regulator